MRDFVPVREVKGEEPYPLFAIVPFLRGKGLEVRFLRPTVLPRPSVTGEAARRNAASGEGSGKAKAMTFLRPSVFVSFRAKRRIPAPFWNRLSPRAGAERLRQKFLDARPPSQTPPHRPRLRRDVDLELKKRAALTLEGDPFRHLRQRHALGRDSNRDSVG